MTAIRCNILLSLFNMYVKRKWDMINDFKLTNESFLCHMHTIISYKTSIESINKENIVFLLLYFSTVYPNLPDNKASAKLFTFFLLQPFDLVVNLLEQTLSSLKSRWRSFPALNTSLLAFRSNIKSPPSELWLILNLAIARR